MARAKEVKKCLAENRADREEKKRDDEFDPLRRHHERPLGVASRAEVGTTMAGMTLTRRPAGLRRAERRGDPREAIR